MAIGLFPKMFFPNWYIYTSTLDLSTHYPSGSWTSVLPVSLWNLVGHLKVLPVSRSSTIVSYVSSRNTFWRFPVRPKRWSRNRRDLFLRLFFVEIPKLHTPPTWDINLGDAVFVDFFLKIENLIFLWFVPFQECFSVSWFHVIARVELSVWMRTYVMLVFRPIKQMGEISLAEFV